MRKPLIHVLIDAQSQDAATFIQLPLGQPLCVFDSRPQKQQQLHAAARSDLLVISSKHALIAAALLLRKPLWQLAHKLASKDFLADAKVRADEAGEAVACEVDQLIRNPPVAAIRLAWRTAKLSISALTAVPRSIPRLLKRTPQPQPYISIEPVDGPKPAAPAAKPKPSATSQPASIPANPQQHPMMQQLAAMGFHPPPGFTPGAAPAAQAAAAPKPAATGGLPAAPRPAASQQVVASSATRSAAPAAAKGFGAGLGGGLPARSKAAGQAAAAPVPPPAAAAKAALEDEEGDDDEWEEADEDDMLQDM